MLSTLRSRLEFIVTFLFPVLLLLSDTLLRLGLNIGVEDVGADMALATVASFLTLIVGELRSLTVNVPASSSSMMATRNPKDLVIMFILANVFGFFWLLTLVIISKADSMGKSLSTSIAISIGLATILTGSRLFFNLISQNTN